MNAKSLVSMVFLGGALFVSERAHAGFDSCGNIDVRAEATCEVAVDCEGQCTPVSVTAACDAQLYGECKGTCSGEPPLECTVDCSADCVSKCTVDEPAFDCNTDCKTTCESECTGHCASNADSANCEASCKATCSGECTTKCEAAPGSATCAAKCEASCSGSCTVQKPYVECQATCQGTARAECTADLQGGCKIACEGDGAVFCDGQYVDSGNNLEECVDALNAYLSAHVRTEGECSGNQCSGSAEVTCSVATPGGPTNSGHGWLGALFGLSLLTKRRQR